MKFLNLVLAFACLAGVVSGQSAMGDDDIGTLPRPWNGGILASTPGGGPGFAAFGDDDISSLPRPWKPPVSGSLGGGETQAQTGGSVWLAAGETWRGPPNVKNKESSGGKVKCTPIKGGASVTGKNGASFEVTDLKTGSAVNVGPNGHAHVSGTGGAVNLNSTSATATVTNTATSPTAVINVNLPSGVTEHVGPGETKSFP